MSHERTKTHVAVCGGGLVGAITACYLARRGFKVDVYERRTDLRKEEPVRGRSYNLAISYRGDEALKQLGLEDVIAKNGIPMHARMIHHSNGNTFPIPYGKKDQSILSFERKRINEILLTAAEKYDDVQIFFEHKLISCDFSSGEITLQNGNGDTVRTQVDLIIGADGAFSSVRREMLKLHYFNYEQEYIPHAYIEMTIPPTSNNEFAMDKNYLHLWPRHDFLLIALPNPDKTFTVNLYMPLEMFDAIKTREDVLKFFNDNFPDSVPWLGEKELADTYMSAHRFPMMTVKCEPFHVQDKAVLMGDAAHAMVPFYGQGMNSGFEDCIIFNEILDKFEDDLAKSLPEFTRIRNIDAKAICELSKYNYFEIRSNVNTYWFHMRKKLDDFLYWLLPNSWVPLYSMVSFTRMPYHECVAKREWQNKVIWQCVSFSTLLAGSLTLGAATYSVVDKRYFNVFGFR